MQTYGTNPSKTGNSGFSLLEVTITLALLAIAGGAVVSAIVTSVMTGNVTRETVLAHEACRMNMEQVQSVAFANIFATFNTDPADDPGGAGTAAGATFAALGLGLQAGDADGVVGRIEFPTMVVGGDLQLREDVVDPGLGMPRDLNLDGIIDSLDHSGDYVILPVRVAVDWTGVKGNRTHLIETVLIDV